MIQSPREIASIPLDRFEQGTATLEAPTLGARLRRAVDTAQTALLALQKDDGHWCAELEGDTILESEYALALHFLDRTDAPRLHALAATLRQKQLPTGGWALYPEGPADVSSSVKAYLVLKLAGDDAALSHMARARCKILELGGLDACNSFTKIYLAICGQWPWSRCPAVVPEMILLPKWLYFNIYAMSSWSRAIVVPLSILWACRPSHPLPAHAQIPELRLPPGERPQPLAPEVRHPFWSPCFELINWGLRTADRLGLLAPWRRTALARAERWILERLEKSDGLGAIFPPIVNTLLAFRCLGYPLDHPVMLAQRRELEKLEIHEGGMLRLQPCKSPVWDTALAVGALVGSGLGADHPAILAGARWLLAREVRQPGDWRVVNPAGPVGGWYFEYANEFYPDCDDTAEVLKALAKVRFPDPAEDAQRRAALERGLAWQLSMQNRDGGWAAFDKDCDKQVLTYIPFADHNAMIDPSTSDITARTLEAIAQLEPGRFAQSVSRAITFLLVEQEADGSWYGRWGCNYLYGTWLALQGLAAIGHDLGHERSERARRFLREHQNLDGGWGELPASYEDSARKALGPSTAAQTAWALLGLFALGEGQSEIVERALEFLLRGQRGDGTWHDEHWTGTGFPKVFYLRYHLYATYFPLLALASFEERRRDSSEWAA